MPLFVLLLLFCLVQRVHCTGSFQDGLKAQGESNPLGCASCFQTHSYNTTTRHTQPQSFTSTHASKYFARSTVLNRGIRILPHSSVVVTDKDANTFLNYLKTYRDTPTRNGCTCKAKSFVNGQFSHNGCGNGASSFGQYRQV